MLRVTSADGAELQVLDRCEGRMKVGIQEYRYLLVVTDIDEEAILGMDSLVDHRVLIDAATRKLQFEPPELSHLRLA